MKERTMNVWAVIDADGDLVESSTGTLLVYITRKEAVVAAMGDRTIRCKITYSI